MPPYAAFLRGINVGGANKVSMADLLAQLSRRGLDPCKSVLQSGNLVFSTDLTTENDIELLIENTLEVNFGIVTNVLVRSIDDMFKVRGDNPFVDMASSDPSHLLVTFLEKEISHSELSSLLETYSGPEELYASGSELYATFPDGIGASRLLAHSEWKRITKLGTGRNWNTIEKVWVCMNGFGA